MTFLHRSPLRWSDLDAQGHVSNVIYLDYLQDARADFFKTGPTADLLDGGVVIVSHCLEYLKPVEYSSDPVDVLLGISSIGASRFEVSYDLSHGGVLKARARSVLCPFDFAAQRPRRLTDIERAYFAEHRVPPEPFSKLEMPTLGGRGRVTELDVRWSDLDAYGHVNNVKFFDYVMQARIETTTAMAPDMARQSGGPSSKYFWLIARQDMQYLNQLNHRIEPYLVRTLPTRIGRSSVTLVAEIVDAQRCYARAATVLVCADASGQPVNLPDEIRGRLTDWMHDRPS